MADSQMADYQMADRDAWIALASVEGVGEETFGLLLATFGSAKKVLAAVVDGRVGSWSAERREADGRPPMQARAVAKLRESAADPSSRLAEIRRLGLWTLTPLDAAYPARLRDLLPPPAGIHGPGDPGAPRAGRAAPGHCPPGPRAHDRLRTEVARAGGAVISEHHPDTKATKGTYPRRNRIIAALSDAL